MIAWLKVGVQYEGVYHVGKVLNTMYNEQCISHKLRAWRVVVQVVGLFYSIVHTWVV